MSFGMSLHESRIQRCLCEGCRNDLSVLRRSGYEGKIQLTCENAPNQLHREHGHYPNLELGKRTKMNRKKRRNPSLVGIRGVPNYQCTAIPFVSSPCEPNG